jgi:hypothetical protein
MNNIDKIKKQLEDLVQNGTKMLFGIEGYLKEADKKNMTAEELGEIKKYVIHVYYQDWYTQSIVIIRQIIPDRLEEFKDAYLSDPKRKSVDLLSYRIQDYLNGMSFKTDRFGEKIANENLIIMSRLNTQINILKSSLTRFDSFLFDIQKIAQADLFDSEIEEAKELLRNKYYRAAGAILGVLLEKHLRTVCNDHSINGLKKNACLADLMKY